MAISQFDVYAPGQFVSQYVPLPFNELMQAGAFRQKQLDDSLNLLEEKRAALDVAGGYSTQDRAKAFRELKNQKLDELSDELIKSGNVLGFRGKVAGVANQLASEYQTLKADEEYRKLVDQIRMKDPKAIYHGYDSELGQWQQQQGNFDPNWYKYTAYADVEKDWLEKGKHLKPDIADLYREGTDISYDENGKAFIRTTTGQRKYLNTNMQRVVDAARAHARYMIANKDTDETADYYFRSNKGNLKKTEEDITKEIIDSWKIFAFDEENTTQGMKPVGQSRTGGGSEGGNIIPTTPDYQDLGPFQYNFINFQHNSSNELNALIDQQKSKLSDPLSILGMDGNDPVFNTFKPILGKLSLSTDANGELKNIANVKKQLMTLIDQGGLPVTESQVNGWLNNYSIEVEKLRNLEKQKEKLEKRSIELNLETFKNLTDLDKKTLKDYHKIFGFDALSNRISDINSGNLTDIDKQIIKTIMPEQIVGTGYGADIKVDPNYQVNSFLELPEAEQIKKYEKGLKEYIATRSKKTGGLGDKLFDAINNNTQKAYEELFADTLEKGNLITFKSTDPNSKKTPLNQVIDNYQTSLFGGIKTNDKGEIFPSGEGINNQVFNYKYIDPVTGKNVALVNGKYDAPGITYGEKTINAMKMDGLISTRDGWYVVISPYDENGKPIKRGKVPGKEKQADNNLQLMVKIEGLDKQVNQALLNNKDSGELISYLEDKFNSHSGSKVGTNLIVTDGYDANSLIEGVAMHIQRSSDGKIKLKLSGKDPRTGKDFEGLNPIYEFKDIGEFAETLQALQYYFKSQNSNLGK